LQRGFDGGENRLVGIVQDITERRRATEELRASEQRYRRIIETTAEGVWLLDSDSSTVFVNTRMADLLGYTRDEMVGKPMLSFMDQERAALVQLSTGERLRNFSDGRDFRFKRKDGTLLWASLATNPLYDENGRYEGALAMVSDVTERRRAEATRNQLAAIVECSDDAIFAGDLEGIITSWNLGAQRLFGFTPTEAIGKHVSLLVPAERRGEPTANLQRILRGQSVDHWETVRRRKDGTLVEVSITLSLLKDAPGRVVGVSAIERDLTERRRAEQQLRKTEERLRQAQKMEAIGSLAGGVAHDFNNLLSVIVSYTSMILDTLKPADPLRADLEEVMKAGLRAADLTRQLLAFSRKQVLEPRVFDLNETLGGMERMLGRLLGEDVDLLLLPSASRGKVRADPGQIEQVIMNLAINARDAMPKGGRLTIETNNVDIDESHAFEHLEIESGSYVMLAVSDTGVGMDAATRSRIFEPFFTTKEPGRGTGLGLSTVLGIVQQSGGSIWVYSEPGTGSTFKVYLPRTDEPTERPSVPPQAHGTLRGSETILLVEDDDQVRALTRTILHRNGYTVLEAQNGGEAFLICEQQQSRIHLLLTDIVMPRMNGRKLAERLLSIKPDMKVLYMSGYTDGSIVHHGVLEPGIAFMQKPITPDALGRKIRAVLDDSNGR
ncbi:MAG TPA: PAS domain S-box protein, partial [Polyangiaceae bacterium]|nr:PAS domain S-box protein [Polyangiaceae bacterium]